jgi:hypothetical protein
MCIILSCRIWDSLRSGDLYELVSGCGVGCGLFYCCIQIHEVDGREDTDIYSLAKDPVSNVSLMCSLSTVTAWNTTECTYQRDGH